MTPEERQLITGLFDRMRNIGNLDKDRDAEALIAERVRSMPDAPYMLVQSVLVQEQALQQAERRIRELEEDLRDLEAAQESRAPAAGGGFLGGLFGGGRPASQPSASSVPPIGSRARSFPPPGADDRPGLGAFGGAQQRPAAGGGFMQQAMATAAGVAGGMLAAGAIRDLLGGGSSAQASTGGKEGAGGDAATQQAGKEGTGEDKNVQNASNEQSEKDRQDDNYQDAHDDDAGGWDDGGEYDI
jgi:hypothetical protein